MMTIQNLKPQQSEFIPIYRDVSAVQTYFLKPLRLGASAVKCFSGVSAVQSFSTKTSASWRLCGSKLFI